MKEPWQMLRMRERTGRKEAFVEGEGALTLIVPDEADLSVRALSEEYSWELTWYGLSEFWCSEFI